MSVSFARWSLGPFLFCLLLACSHSDSDEVADPSRLSESATDQRKSQPSPDTSLYGFQLGRPPGVPPCEKQPPGDPAQSCLADDHLRLGEAERPKELHFEHLNVVVDPQQGLQEISAFLKPDDAHLVLQLAQIKYGLPDYVPGVVQKYPMWTWTYADMEVELLGYSDMSSITIATTVQAAKNDAKAEVSREAERAEEAKKRRM